MNHLKKIPFFAFILALMLSAGNACIFPVLPAQAVETDHVDHHTVIHETTHTMTENDVTDADTIAVVPYSENHVKKCAMECGQLAIETVGINTLKETVGLPMLTVYSYSAPSLVKADFGTPEPPGNTSLQQAILTVSKKE